MSEKLDEANKIRQDAKTVRKDIDETIKTHRKLIADLKSERERVRIGFLNGETPRLMSLLTDSITVLETYINKLKKQRKRVKQLEKLLKLRNVKRKEQAVPVPLK